MDDKLKGELQELANQLDRAAESAGVVGDLTGTARSIEPDEPIRSSGEDQLNRARFATELARAVANFSRAESLVVGIYGAWGTGKTSLLNLIEEKLQLESADPPLVFKFDPWGFSDQDQLSARFFSELAAFARLHLSLPSLADVSETIEEYGELLNPVAQMILPRVAQTAKVGWSLFRRFRPTRRRSVGELKSAINAALKRSGSKLLIILDDIDRLNATEIRQAFQLIKLNANFSNTVFLVAFDRRPVEKALLDVAPGPPHEYLEKIVQVGFDLPPLQGTRLTEIILADFNELLARVGRNINEQRFGNMFHEGFRESFRTIRDVKRYFNVLRLALTLVHEDTDFTDLAAVQALAVFYPDVYSAVQRNQDLFCGIWSRFAQPKPDDLKKTYDQIFSTVAADQRKPALSICGFLFPKFASEYSEPYNMTYSPDSEAEWRKAKRIASRKYFPYYFQLAVPDTEVSQSEMDEAIRSATSVEAFTKTLAAYKASDRLSPFLDLLRDSLAPIGPAELNTILRSVFVFGDEANIESSEGLGLITEHTRIGTWLVLDVLDRLPADKRFAELLQAMRQGQAVYTIVKLTVLFEEGLSKSSDDDFRRRYPDLSENVVAEMRVIATEALSHAAATGKLQLAPRFPFLLYRWKEWGKAADMDAWIRATFLSGPREAVLFVSGFLQRQTSYGFGDSVPRVQLTLSVKPLGDFVDLKILRELVSVADDSELSERERTAKSEFLSAMKKMDAGWNPDDENALFPRT
ncbi:MAG TPA: P-loop NTPase fold protein [Terriglobia bacterium]|nr:P-loop NTPase fold protein [Terriglobia bacterium]